MKGGKRIAIIAAVLALIVGAGLFVLRMKHDGPWTVTQYASGDGNQMMCYTIENAKGELAIIDGGWPEDAEQLKAVIEEHNGHVKAWVITHPHPDHVGAFNSIMAANTDGSVVVDKIYTVPVNRQRYKETARSYDVIDAYEIFYILTKDADNVVYLNENDDFDLIGLDALVLHSWDENVDALPHHLCNDGSLMFKVKGRRDSMLFCADVQSEMEEFIIPKHAKDLKSTYVQLGHHGNWGLTTGFYDLVEPKAAFFDAPSSIIDNEDQKYDGYILRDYLLKKGVELIRPETAPNELTIR